MNPKRILPGLLLLSAYAAAARQSLGLQAGIGVSRVSSGVFENHGGPRLRPGIGFTYEGFINEHVTLGADLLYQQRGFTDRIALFNLNGTPMGTGIISFRYSYAALPLKVGYQFGNRGFGFGKIGLVPAVLVKATALRPGDDIAGRVSSAITDHLQRFDLGAIAEAGGGFRVDPETVVYAALSYQQSFTSFTDPDLYRSRHMALYLNLGIRFGLGGRKPAKAAPAAE